MAVAFARVLRGAEPERAGERRRVVRRGARRRRARAARRRLLGRALDARAPPGGPRPVRPGVPGVLGRRTGGVADDEDPSRRRSRSSSTATRTTPTATTPRAAPPNDDPSLELRFSMTEVLRHKDFAAYDDAELAEAHRLMAGLRFAGSPRRSLRMSPTTHRTAGPTCAAPCAPRCAPRASRSAATSARRPRATAGSCCCSTSAARWSRTPGPCCASCRPPSPVADASRRSPSAPG